MTQSTGRTTTVWIGASLALFLTSAIALPFVGPALDWSLVRHRQEPDWSILSRLRLSRTVLGLFAGGSLALGGSLFQSMLRDVLATPYTLGVSAGASLGAVIAIVLHWQIGAGVVGVWAGALIGAGMILLIVMGAATRRGNLSVSGLVLSGIALNSVCAAVILLLHSLAGISQSYAISRWLIGSLDAVEFPVLAVYVTVVVSTALMVVRRARAWNLLAVGEDWAATRGENVRALVVEGYVAGSILAAATVALTGPIAFIGLVVPHLLRQQVGSDDRLVMPCAFLLGGVLLAGCDAIGRVILSPAEIPAGAITALIGGPFLIWIVRRGDGR